MLILHGGKWTNGRNKGSGYDGNGVESFDRYNFIDSYVGIKFMVRAGGKYSSYTITPKGLKSGVRYTTHNTWAKSVLIKENGDLFQTIRIDKFGNWELKLSRLHYDREVLFQKSGRLSEEEKKALKNAKLLFTFGDNYAGGMAKLFIYEIEFLKTSSQKK